MIFRRVLELWHCALALKVTIGNHTVYEPMQRNATIITRRQRAYNVRKQAGSCWWHTMHADEVSNTPAVVCGL